MSITSSLLGAILIPASLAGIGVGLAELVQAADEIRLLVDQLINLGSDFWPWCRGILCLTMGGFLLGLAGALLIRGLQSSA